MPESPTSVRLGTPSGKQTSDWLKRGMFGQLTGWVVGEGVDAESLCAIRFRIAGVEMVRGSIAITINGRRRIQGEGVVYSHRAIAVRIVVGKVSHEAIGGTIVCHHNDLAVKEHGP